jgi:anti-sigma regulatory factor (Ser/Thr protein kinase)
VVAQTSRDFEPDIAQVSAARRFAMSAAETWRVESGIVGLVVTELAANAVLHARSPFTVSLHDEPARRRLVIEVADSDPKAPAKAPIEPDALSGRGLILVEQVAAAWGVRPQPPGKVVWVELDMDGYG